ncbi:hypothetical protein [Streptomyces sp. NBC_01518]
MSDQETQCFLKGVGLDTWERLYDLARELRAADHPRHEIDLLQAPLTP